MLKKQDIFKLMPLYYNSFLMYVKHIRYVRNERYACAKKVIVSEYIK